MIEDKKNGMTVAESPREAMITETIGRTKQRITQEELGLEIDRVLLQYLETESKKFKKQKV